MTWGDWADVAAGLGAGSVLTGILARMLSRKLDGATIEELETRTEKIAIESAKDQIELMRLATQEMRNSYEDRITMLIEDKTRDAAESAKQIATIKEKYETVVHRIDKLEERERHMLTRAAVHEAWDQMAFSIISQSQPDFQPPPPIIVEAEVKEIENIHAKTKRNRTS